MASILSKAGKSALTIARQTNLASTAQRSMSAIVKEIKMPEGVAQFFEKQVSQALEKGRPKPGYLSDANADWAAKQMKKAISKHDDGEFAQALDDFRKGKADVLKISGLPMVEQMDLPADRHRDSSFDATKLDADKQLSMAKSSAVMAGLVGAMDLEYRLDGDDPRRITAITPLKNGRGFNKKDVGEHTDNYGAHEAEDVNDYTALLAIQNNEKRGTEFLAAKDIFEKLSKKDQNALLKKKFYVNKEVDDYYSLQQPTVSFGVFEQDESGTIGIRYGYAKSFEGISEIQAERKEGIDALKSLNKVIAELSTKEVNLDNAEMLVFNNKTTMHKRGEAKKASFAESVGTADDARSRLLLRAELNKPGASEGRY